MKITLTNRTNRTVLTPVTPIVFGDNGGIYIDPEIIDVDGEDVIFKARWRWTETKEMMGKAVTVATLTMEEIIKLAKSGIDYDVRVNNKLFTNDRRGNFCAGFVKKRGYRTWLLPVTDEEACGLMEKTKKIVYYTYNGGAKVVEA